MDAGARSSAIFDSPTSIRMIARVIGSAPFQSSAFHSAAQGVAAFASSAMLQAPRLRQATSTSRPWAVEAIPGSRFRRRSSLQTCAPTY
jgi:hypothetical protein